MRWNWAALVVLAAGAALPAADEKVTRLRFSRADLGKVAAGWKADQTGKGAGSVWKVVADDTAPSKAGYVLAQTAESPSLMFNLCVAEKPTARDVEVTVAFKAVKGKKDQGGGVVWRYQDARNYYVARFNPLEDNYRLYKVVAGKRVQLETKEDLPVKVGEWHTLRVRQAGEQIECFLDGKKLLAAKDGTFTKAGKVGLWTKADAQTHFDDFRVTELGK
jgi:hypothetical protein